MEFVVKLKKRGKLLGFVMPKEIIDTLGIKENSTVKFELCKVGSQFCVSGIRVLD